MNVRDSELDRLLAEWLEDDAFVAPANPVEAAVDFARSHPRRRDWLAFARRDAMTANATTRLRPVAVLATVAVLLVIGAATAALLGSRSNGVGGPSATSTASPEPSSAASQSSTLAPISLTGQIAFARTLDGNTDIYLMNLDRSGLVRLTDDPGIEGEPSWSGDGRKIAFTRGSGDARDVYVMNADGSGEVRVTSSPEGEDGPTLSFDGSQVAFLRYKDPTLFDILVSDIDGSGVQSIYRRESPYAAHPHWSVDESALYFNLDTGGGLEIAQVDLVSGDVALLTNLEGDDSTFALSADGSTIAFQSDRAPGGIFLMNADGTNVRHLVGDWDKGYPMSWSPDGKHLVYALPDGWLYLVPVTGAEEPVKWTEGDLAVAWRPAP